MTNRNKFLKIYSKVPFILKNEIIMVYKKEPISWNVAWLEIKQNTKIGREILEGLERMELI